MARFGLARHQHLPEPAPEPTKVADPAGPGGSDDLTRCRLRQTEVASLHSCQVSYDDLHVTRLQVDDLHVTPGRGQVLGRQTPVAAVGTGLAAEQRSWASEEVPRQVLLDLALDQEVGKRGRVARPVELAAAVSRQELIGGSEQWFLLVLSAEQLGDEEGQVVALAPPQRSSRRGRRRDTPAPMCGRTRSGPPAAAP